MQRSVRSVKWNTLATVLGFPLGFIQTVLLARLLPVEYFGVIATVNSLIGLSSTVFEFGLGNAYLHRAPETQDEEQATAAFFTLRLVFDSAWAVFLLLFGWLSLTGMRQWVLVFLVVAGYLARLTAAPQALLMRRVQHRRLAALSLVGNLTLAIASVSIAWLTHSIWALLVSSIITLVFGVAGFYLWKPVWKPRLAWDAATVRYFLSFGARNLVNNFLDGAIENSDNLWTGYYLGDLQLGYYSRAFRFAIYPRILITTPVNSVAFGTFSELKFDRLRLSKAFFRTSVLLTRMGFLAAGLLAVIAPEFITLFLGEKWLPMLAAFRLMLVYSLLDPLRVITSSLMTAVGKPEKISQVRLLQILILGVGLFLLGLRYQIAGVALALDLMALVGLLLSLRIVREFVDFSYFRLLAPPILALLAGIGLNLLVKLVSPERSLETVADLWLALLIQSIAFGSGYLALLMILEGKELYQSFAKLVSTQFAGLATLVKRVQARFGRG